VKLRRNTPEPEKDHEEIHEMLMNKLANVMPMRQPQLKDESIPLEDSDTNRHYLEGKI